MYISNKKLILIQSKCNRMASWPLCAVDSRQCPMKSSFAVVTHLSIMNEDSKSHWLIDIFYNPEVVVVSLPHPFCLLNYKSIY